MSRGPGDDAGQLGKSLLKECDERGHVIRREVLPPQPVGATERGEQSGSAPAAFGDAGCGAWAAPLGVEAGGVLPMTRVARPSADSPRAAWTAYLGRVSSKAMASPEGIRPGPVRPRAGREEIGNGSA